MGKVHTHKLLDHLFGSFFFPFLYFNFMCLFPLSFVVVVVLSPDDGGGGSTNLIVLTCLLSKPGTCGCRASALYLWHLLEAAHWPWLQSSIICDALKITQFVEKPLFLMQVSQNCTWHIWSDVKNHTHNLMLIRKSSDTELLLEPPPINASLQ